MTTYKAFNSMLSEFFNDLADTFDEYPVIRDAKVVLDGILAADDCTDVPMEKFVEVFKPHAGLIVTKDPKLFDVCQIPMISGGEFDMAKEWATLEDDNRDAIWDYIQQLYFTGSTILSMSEDVLKSVECVAKGCIQKVESGELTENEAKNPMFILQEIMKNPDIMEALK